MKRNTFLILILTLGVKEFATEYVVPQDNSNRTDVRWFSIGDLHVSAVSPFNFRAWPYAESELETAVTHTR